MNSYCAQFDLTFKNAAIIRGIMLHYLMMLRAFSKYL